MFNIIGTGLKSFLDIPYSSIKTLKKSKYVFLEAYTCIIDTESLESIVELQKIINKQILPLQRFIIESSPKFLKLCKENEVTLLVVGTPFFATTHLDLLERCIEMNIETNIVHNSSIQNVIGRVGLYSYNFGRTISLPYFFPGFQPTSIYDYLKKNKEIGLHTLVLLDIQMENKLNTENFDEYISKSDKNLDENLFSLNKNHKFMTINEAIEQLIVLEKLTKYNLLTEDSKIFAICRFATKSEKIFFDKIENLRKMDFGAPLHSLIIPGKIDHIEEELIEKII